MVILSKAIGGGLPLSVVVYRAELDQWQPGAHAGTFRGNQMAMAAGAATIEFVRTHRLDQNAQIMGERLLLHLRQAQASLRSFGDVRGRGLMIGVEIVDTNGRPDARDVYPAAPELARKIQAQALSRGLILELGGRNGCVVRFLSPLTVTEEEVDTIASIFYEAARAAEQGSR